jgi:hypothetical protein
MEFYEDDDDIRCNYSMPVDADGEYWKTENARHYVGSDIDGWKKCWSYEIVSTNVIDVTVDKTGKKYRFTRE